MKFLMLINHGSDNREWDALSDAEQRDIGAAWQAISNHPGVTPGHQLQPPDTATTVRVQDGRTLTTDGPYVETKEALDGYFILEADDLDAAIEVASRVPSATSGTVEIRPIVEW